MVGDRISPARRAIYLAILLAVVAAICEGMGALAYRFLLADSERQLIEATIGVGHRGWTTVYRYRPHAYLNYVGNPDYRFEDGSRPHHEIGIRDPGFPPTSKQDGVLRIVALGGSTTYGMYFEKVTSVWPHIVGMGLGQTLEREIEVVNAGVLNYTTYEMIGMAAFWLPEFQPDLVLLHTGLNDAYTVGYRDEGGPDAGSFRHAWSHRPLSRPLKAAMRASRLARFLGVKLLRRSGVMAGDMTGAIQYPKPPLDELESNVPAATGKYFRRNLETLVLLVRRTGARLVLVDMPTNPEFDSGLGPFYDAVSAAVIRNNRIVHEIGQQQGIPVVGLYDRMRDPTLFTDAAHVNQKGMIRKAQIVYETVKPILSERPGAPVPPVS